MENTEVRAVADIDSDIEAAQKEHESAAIKLNEARQNVEKFIDEKAHTLVAGFDHLVVKEARELGIVPTNFATQPELETAINTVKSQQEGSDVQPDQSA